MPSTMPPVAPAEPSLMRTALCVLLDRVPNSRSVFRHLAAVENDLGRKDATGRFLYDQPSERLRVVQRQLDGLMSGTAPNAGLAALSTCLNDAIATREAAEQRNQPREVVSSFFVDHKLEVSEGRHSEFDELLAATWPGIRKTPPPAA